MTCSRALSLLTALLFVAGCGHTTAETASMEVRIHQLGNGLTVYLTKNDQEPRVYTEIAVRAGSKHDPADNTGLAHYLEHLLFKGSQSFGTLDYDKERPHLETIEALYEERFKQTDPAEREATYAKISAESVKAGEYAIANELDRFYQAIGGRHVNAHTSDEETVYKVGVPKNRLEQWARLEAERFRAPVWRLFQPELEVVYEEKNRSIDSKQRKIMEAVDALLYPVHPYGQQPTIGTVAHLKNPSLKTITAYYNKHYVPGNMAVFMSGDMDIDKTIALLERTLGAWPARPVPPQPTWVEKPHKGVKRVSVKYPGEEFLLIAFPTASNSSKNAEALKLVDMILDNSTAGLINLNLNQTQKVRAAGSFPRLRNDEGAQYLWGVPKEGQSLKEAEDLLLAQLNRIKAGDFDGSLLPAIVADYKSSRAHSLESNKARVSMMRSSWLQFQSWPHAQAEIARMSKLTKEDVVRVANQYFGDAYVVGYREDGKHEVPSIQKPKIAPIKIDPTRQSNFMAELMAHTVAPIAPKYIEAGRDYVVETVAPGADLYHVTNPVNDLFSLSLRIDVGLAQRPALEFAARLLRKSGAGDLSPAALNKAWYSLGTTFRIQVGRDETTLDISGLGENFEESVRILMDLIKRPVMEQKTLDRAVNIAAGEREDGRKDQKTIIRALQQYSQHGAKSRYLTRLPIADARKLKVAELSALIGGLLDYNHRISYVGKATPAAVRDLLAGHRQGSAALKAPPVRVAERVATPEKTEIRFVHKEMAQALVRIDFTDGRFDEADGAMADLFNSYFGSGMNSIVFQELRESRALAYTARARYYMGRRADDDNLLTSQLGTQADKTSGAIEVLLSLMDKLPESANRFKAARDARITGYRTGRIQFRRITSDVWRWLGRGLKPDPRKARYEATQSATLKDLLAFHKAHIANRPKLISIVGDKTRIDMEALGKLGTIIMLEPEAILAL